MSEVREIIVNVGYRVRSEELEQLMESAQQGRAGFEAYVAAVGGTTHDGRPIPTWDELTDAVREGWRAAAASTLVHAARTIEDETMPPADAATRGPDVRHG